MRRASLLLAAAVAATTGCGAGGAGGDSAPKASSRLVDLRAKPPYVNSFEIDPATGDLLLTTNRGFWRIDRDTGRVARVRGRVAAGGRSDTVGTFLEVQPAGGRRLLGSGHPDHQDTLPQFLGVLESGDGGRSWRVLSRLGDADLHEMVVAHGRLYAFDAVLGAMLISRDGGRTFTERLTPRGLVIDFAVHPGDPAVLVAATEEQLFRSDDEGRRWRPLARGRGIRLAWPAPDRLLRADADGTVQVSADRGDSFEPVGRLPGEPYEIATGDGPQHLLAALSDATVMETRDGGRTWKAVFRP